MLLRILDPCLCVFRIRYVTITVWGPCAGALHAGRHFALSLPTSLRRPTHKQLEMEVQLLARFNLWRFALFLSSSGVLGCQSHAKNALDPGGGALHSDRHRCGA